AWAAPRAKPDPRRKSAYRGTTIRCFTRLNSGFYRDFGVDGHSHLARTRTWREGSIQNHALGGFGLSTFSFTLASSSERSGSSSSLRSSGDSDEPIALAALDAAVPSVCLSSPLAGVAPAPSCFASPPFGASIRPIFALSSASSSSALPPALCSSWRNLDSSVSPDSSPASSAPASAPAPLSRLHPTQRSNL